MRVKLLERGVRGLALLTALCVGTSAYGAPGDKVVFKFGHLANEQNTWHLAALKMAELASKYSSGKIEIKVFPNEQLGKETDMITGIQSGSVDMTITGESLQNWAPLAAMLAVPYAVRDESHLDKVANGEVGKQIEKQIVDKVGLRPLLWFARGPRYLTSNRPIKTPAELKGILLRVPNVPLFVNVWSALGAKPTPMAFSEVFTALQQKTIEGQENPLALIDSASFQEVQKYVNRTAHVRSWIYVVIGEKQYQALSPEQREALTKAAREAQAYERTLFVAEEKRLEKKLQDAGMQFADVDMAAFQSKAKEAVLASLKPDQKEVYEKIVAIK
jgi:TRAP-type transport system periplasmic protein